MAQTQDIAKEGHVESMSLLIIRYMVYFLQNPLVVNVVCCSNDPYQK